jgi:hypothetical protein
MPLYSRVATLTGGPVEPVEWAVDITGKVNQIMDVEVSLWQGVFGYPLGTVAWSAMVESRAQLAEQTAKLAADSAFLDLAGAGQAFATTPFEDVLRSIVHMTREPEGSPPMGGWAEVTTATPAEGKIGEAMAWGVEIADAYTAATGTGCAFLADDYGTFGQVTLGRRPRRRRRHRPGLSGRSGRRRVHGVDRRCWAPLPTRLGQPSGEHPSRLSAGRARRRWVSFRGRATAVSPA